METERAVPAARVPAARVPAARVPAARVPAARVPAAPALLRLGNAAAIPVHWAGVKRKKAGAATLRQALSYEPVELAFGTSGLRGLVSDITNLEAYVNVHGFVEWLLARGDTAAGGEVFVAGDLRPSTAGLVASPSVRGEIMQAACRAIADAGLVPISLDSVPTPALVLHALRRSAPAVMVTGSHIPWDRNGIKLTTPNGEVTKADEAPILAAVRAARDREYSRPVEESIFDASGMIRAEHRAALPTPLPDAGEEYARRYLSAFAPDALAARRILVWEHSAVGRELLARVLGGMGAQVVAVGRTDEFVAVDTEAVDASMLRTVQGLVDANGGAALDAVVSTDGDSDRPLLFAVDGGRVRLVPGDILGVLAADFLGARHAAVPVNVTDAVDEYCRRRGIALVKTRIGSPHVIAAMRSVAWEANGGFMTATALEVPRGGRIDPLPTRDPLLPLLAVLCASLGSGKSVSALLDTLPPRFGRSAVVRDFPAEEAREIMRWLSPADSRLRLARFSEVGIAATSLEGGETGTEATGAPPGSALSEELAILRERIARTLASDNAFGEPQWVDWLDGVRAGFAGGDVLHIRPSGNAPEMRVYVVSGSPERAESMVAAATSETGTVRRLEREAAERMALAAFRAQPRPLPLRGAVQHYEWGGHDFIPALIGADNPDGKPYAELWMGAHPRAPALAEVDGARVRLDRLIDADPWAVLGSDAALRFAGRLPYLFKVLDVRVMASIQAHPSKTQAEEGFARENALGIPVDAPHRNYRDENHKPEVHVALTDFWMLHGFRPLEEIGEVLASEPELAACMPGFDARLRAAGPAGPAARSSLVRDLYERVMTMPQPEVDAMLDPLVARLEEANARSALRRDNPGFWALRAARSFPLSDRHRDRGIISVYLLNLVTLKPGQGTFQPAGTLHAYLEGADVELMANSDNVLRGGLTPKHVDAKELLSTLDFRDGRPPILEGRAASETGREYETPAEEFALERIEVSPGVPNWGGRDHGADTIIVIEGAAALVAAGRTLSLPRGGITLVPAGVPYSIAARSPHAVLFKASVPPGESRSA